MPRKPSRIRRIAKWSGFGACVFIVAAWGISLWYRGYARLWWHSYGSIANGFVNLQVRRDKIICPAKPGIYRHRNAGVGLGFPRMRGFSTQVTDISVPLWLFLLGGAMPTGILFYLDRRRIPPGHCLTCGYDLTGNVSGICPECGTNTGASSRRAVGSAGESGGATASMAACRRALPQRKG